MTGSLIPRTRLFGNPARAQGQISPDGRWLSWLAPKDGVLNIWVAPTGNIGAGRVITDRQEARHPLPCLGQQQRARALPPR